MEERNSLRVKQMRKECSVHGWALLIYLAIFYASNIIALLVDRFIAAYYQKLYGTESVIYQSEGAWGYFLAIFVGLILLLIWKKPDFCTRTIWKKGRPMRVDDFVLLLVLFLGVQGVIYVVMMITEMILNSNGLSIMEGYSEVAGGAEDFVSFLYLGFGAPITEELLFRGMLLRPLEKMGKKFAILTSAILFGLYHCNIVQAPFAILVGLVLGYVTVEYSIGWAMVLHMFNNLIYADTLPRLMPGIEGNLASLAIAIGCLIAGVIILLLRKKDIRAYRKQNRNEQFCWRAFLTAPGMIAVVAATIGWIVYTLSILITRLS